MNTCICIMEEFGLTVKEIGVVGTLAEVHQNVHEAGSGARLTKHI